MPIIHKPLRAALAVLALASPAHAGDMAEGWDWLASTNEIQTEGVFWNDRYGDGKDRWKTGGITQAYVFPEHIFSNDNWFKGRASALELNLRALVITPDDTSFTGNKCRPRTGSASRPAGKAIRCPCSIFRNHFTASPEPMKIPATRPTPSRAD
jgi:hypothetical protein